MSMVRELIKYYRHPKIILPRLLDKIISPFNYLLAKLWLLLRGRDKLRQSRQILMFGGFGGRRYDDNSAAIFEYMLSNYPKIDSYWVIRKDCFFDKTTEREMPPYEKVIFKDTLKANILALIADAYIYSHGRYDITDYKLSDTPLVINIRLGHGFNALKKTHMIRLPSGKNVSEASLYLDIITASSENEALIHNKEWGIPFEKIVITGMARHDRLYSLKKTIQNTEKNILFMPTWRDWNSRKFSLAGSNFLSQIRSFIVDSPLDEYLTKNGIHLQIYVHMWMREFFDDFRKNFSLKSIEILDQGVDLQKTIVRSSLLITDYSSICWDFLLLDKPVLFYQFDLDEYLKKTGAYIDLEKDLFGPSAHNADDAMYWVRHFVETDFSSAPFEQQMKEKKHFAFAYQDGKNCERLAQIILKMLPEIK